jgi:hypothetical protein
MEEALCPNHSRRHTLRRVFRGAMACLIVMIGFVGAPAPGRAAPPESDPAATIAALYRAYQGKEDPNVPQTAYSARLRKLFDADRKATTDGEVGRLDFDPIINGQDWELKRLSIKEMKHDGDQALVRATFMNMNSPEDLRFSLVREGGRWVIDEIVSETKPQWTLSKILAGAPDAFGKD